MTEKIIQLVQKEKYDPTKSPEFIAALDEIIDDIKNDRTDYVIIVGRDTEGLGCMTNLDLPSSNFLIDLVKMNGLMQAGE